MNNLSNIQSNKIPFETYDPHTSKKDYDEFRAKYSLMKMQHKSLLLDFKLKPRLCKRKVVINKRKNPIFCLPNKLCELWLKNKKSKEPNWKNTGDFNLREDPVLIAMITKLGAEACSDNYFFPENCIHSNQHKIYC